MGGTAIQALIRTGDGLLPEDLDVLRGGCEAIVFLASPLVTTRYCEQFLPRERNAVRRGASWQHQDPGPEEDVPRRVGRLRRRNAPCGVEASV